MPGPWEQYQTGGAEPWKRYAAQPDQAAAPEQSWLEELRGGLASAPINAYLGAKQLISGELSPVEQNILEQNRAAEQRAPIASALSNVATMAIPGGAAIKGAQLAGRGAGVVSTAGRALAAPATVGQAAAGGAAYGALQPTMGDESRVQNALLGGAGGAAGYGLGALAGRIAKPVQGYVGPEGQEAASMIGQSPRSMIEKLRAPVSDERAALVRAAEAENIPLSAGQRTGSKPMQSMEAAMVNIPATAEAAAEQGAKTQRAFTAAALRRAGIESDVATPEVLNARFAELGKKYEKLSEGRAVKLGDDFLNTLAEVDAAQTEVRGVLPTAKIDNIVDGFLDKIDKGTMTGEAAQTIRSQLTKETKKAYTAGNARLGDALKQMRNGIDDAIRGGLSEGEKKVWDESRKQYANLKTLTASMDKATAGAAEGQISPAALSQALKSSMGRESLARGRGDLNELARVGQALVKPQVADSGTAQRMMYQNMLTSGGLGLGGYAMTGDPTLAMTAAGGGYLAPKVIQKLMQSAAGQKYLTEGLSPEKQAIVNYLRAYAPAAGTAGALEVSR